MQSAIPYKHEQAVSEVASKADRLSDELGFWLQTKRKPWQMHCMLVDAKKCFQTAAPKNLAYRLDFMMTPSQAVLMQANVETAKGKFFKGEIKGRSQTFGFGLNL
jgi:hypothetical protein